MLDTAVWQINENTELKIGYTLLKQVRVVMARRHLEALGTKDAKLISRILGDEQLLNELFTFIYRLKTDK